LVSPVVPSAAARLLDETVVRVTALIAAHTGIRAEKISPQSRVDIDLRIAGDDLVELVDHLFEALHIAPGDFSYRDYGSAEGLNLLGTGGEKSLSVAKPLTVSRFAQAALDGRW
jgi:hypothetical protein